jgi:hypothetical protein
MFFDFLNRIRKKTKNIVVGISSIFKRKKSSDISPGDTRCTSAGRRATDGPALFLEKKSIFSI